MARKRLLWQARIGILAMGVNFLLCLALLGYVYVNGPTAMTMGAWPPPFGISFAADLVGATLAATGSAIALACGVHAIQDIGSDGIGSSEKRYGFFSFLCLLAAGVNGAFLTADVFNLYVWFEVSLIASFGLIILGGEPKQLDGGVKYSFLNLVGTTLFLMAVGCLYGSFGTLNVADLIRKMPQHSGDVPISAIAALFLIAFAMKAAAFPVNFWLPASYHTPRIVVSALFAGLLTKVGVYALMRIHLMLFVEQRETFSTWIALVAAATAISGALGALAQADLRRMMGFLVISGIGTMLAGAAIATDEAIAGTIIYAVHSMIVTAALYLAAGSLARKTGSFDLHELAGNWKQYPGLATGFLLLGFAIAGIPPLSGFWPKIMIVKAAIFEGYEWLAAALLLAALLTTLAIGRVWLLAFWRPKPTEEIADQSRASRSGSGMRESASTTESAGSAEARLSSLPLAALVAAAVLIGAWPEPLAQVAIQGAQTLENPFQANGYFQAVFGEAK